MKLLLKLASKALPSMKHAQNFKNACNEINPNFIFEKGLTKTEQSLVTLYKTIRNGTFTNEKLMVIAEQFFGVADDALGILF